jgi:glycosyltransferase involved in cell wall biosynthesis
MNIWYFCVNPNISLHNMQYAPSIHIRETIQSLQALGHQVNHFLYADNLGPTEAKLRRGGKKEPGKTDLLLQPVKPLLRDVYELYQNLFQDRSRVEPIFRDHSIDLVYERMFPSRSIVSTCTQKYKVPLIVESNAPGEERKVWGSPLYPLVGRIEKKILQQADAITVVSTPLKRHYEQEGIPPHKIVVLPNGVNEKRFSAANVSCNVREALGLEDKVVIGFVGNIRAYHGVELLVPLAHQLNLVKDNLHFLIVGDETGRDELKALLASEKLDQFFSLAGPVPNSEVPNYIAAMDICLLPRFMWYGSPMKIFEYGAMGKAIIAPDLENIREVLRHEETAYLFELDNIAALAQAVQALVSNPQFRTQLGDAVRQYILAHHTWIRKAEKIVEVHHQIVSGKNGRFYLEPGEITL